MAHTRRHFLALGASVTAAAATARRLAAAPVRLARATPAQLRWQRDERALFFHFGVNTFTDREWGDGTESPRLFNPSRLDCGQWTRAARAAGFRAAILTAKHHDGFCLWPSRLTTHTVAASPWRGGHGDVVREFVDACHASGIAAGLYVSPWDRHEPSYGDSPRYNDFYCGQLTELLTCYGPLQEIWFDGANGEGANGKHQVYDWRRIWALVRRLQPGALMFSDAGPDLRWIGNERGTAGDPDWAAVDPTVVQLPGQGGAAVTAMLQHGDPHGAVWRPGEADVSLRPGWFYHAVEDARLKSVDELAEIYFQSVGRNAKLLLNVPPTPEGRLHAGDVARLQAFDAHLRDRLNPRRSGAAVIVDLREDVAEGQRVSSYVVEGQTDSGAWVELSRGTTIGVRKLDRIAPAAAVSRVRVRVLSAIAPPGAVQVAVVRQ